MNVISFIFPLDYIIIVITILFVIFSAWKGVIQSILGLLTWIGSIIITLYTYNSFSLFIYSQITKIQILKNYEMFSNFVSIIIAIPIIFLISLFILKKIRVMLSSDLDKQILGLIIDKFFGSIYGVVFSYFIFSTLLFTCYNLNLIDLNNWFIDNSNILNNINIINKIYIYPYIISGYID